MQLMESPPVTSPETNSQHKKQGHVRFKDAGDIDGPMDDSSSADSMERRLPLTNVETFLHLLKCLLGTGILAMPKAFCYAGWVSGLFGSALIAIISTYCVHLLLRTQHEMCRRLKVCNLSYSETARKSMLEGPVLCGKLAQGIGALTNFFIVLDQVGTCCVYVIFVASNLKEVLDQYIVLDIRLYMTFLLVPLLLLNYVPHLKYLTPFSTFANLVMLTSFGITFYYVYSDLPSLSERKAFGSVGNFPLFIGIVLFSMEAIAMILPLQNKMRTPDSFTGLCGILNQVMILLTVTYIIVGFFGYLKYGENTKGSITLNLPKNHGLVKAVCVMISSSVLLSHALQSYVIIDIIWKENLSRRFRQNRWKKYYEYVTRTAVVALTIVLAVAIPNLEIFISLVGALCVSILAIIFPVMMDTCLFWHSTSGIQFYLMCIKNALLVLFGMFALIVGVYTSIMEMCKVAL